MKVNLNKIQMLFFTVVLINALFLGSCFFLWQKIIVIAGQIDVVEQEVTTQEFQRNNLSQLTLAVEREIRPAQEEISRYFVKGENFIEFIELLESLAEKAQVGVVIRSTDLKNSLRLSIDISGSFSNSMYFVALVESLPINLKIENMRINGVPEDDSWQCGIVMSLSGSGSNKN